MLGKGIQAYRNVVVGLVLSVTLAGCFMNAPTEPGDASNAPPPPETNNAPEILGNAPRVVKVGVTYSFTPQAMDADGDPLSFSINNRPMWLTFDSTNGRISGVPLLGNEGTYNDIEIAVSDGQVSTMLPRFSITVEPNTAPNMPPEIDGTPAAGVTVGDAYTFTPTGSDPDGDPLTFSIQNRPGWATFSSSTGQLSGAPQPGDEGTYTNIAITVSDNVLTASLPAFSITVIAANAAPTISGTPSSAVTAATTYSFVPTASDPNNDPITFSVQNLPGWASFSAVTGELSGTPQAGDVGVHGGIVIGVSDGTLSSSLPAFSISVVAANSPPQISGTPSLIVNVGQSYSFTPTTSDPDGDSLLFSIQNRPGWAQFDTSTGALSGTPQVGDAGSYANISISVSDGNLSDTLPGFTITVNQVSLGSATLNWTPPTQNTDGSVLSDLAGFKIYYGTSLGNYPNQITINNPGVTTYVVDNLSPITWYFVATSFNSSGVESYFSNVASKTIN